MVELYNKNNDYAVITKKKTKKRTSLLTLFKYKSGCFLYIHAVLSSAPASSRREWNPLQN